MKKLINLNGKKYEIRTYNMKRVLTAADIKDIKNLSGTSYVTNYIRRGALKEGIDYYKVPWEVYRIYSSSGSKNTSKGSYIITESGYKIIFKKLDDIDCNIINTYYNDEPVIIKEEKKKDKEKVENIKPQEEEKVEQNIPDEKHISSSGKDVDLLSEFIKMQTNILQEIKDEHIRFLNGMMSLMNKGITSDNEKQTEISNIDISDYDQFKKQITHYANKVLSNSTKYKSTNDILSEAYKRLRNQYGIVWEQEKKDFYNSIGRSPVSTLELEWWIEQKPVYKDLLIGKLETMSRER